MCRYRNTRDKSMASILECIRFHAGEPIAGPEAIKKAFRHMQLFQRDEEQAIDYVIQKLFQQSAQLYAMDYNKLPILFDLSDHLNSHSKLS